MTILHNFLLRARGHQIFYALAFFSFAGFFFASLIILAPKVLSQHSEMIQSEIREDPGLESSSSPSAVLLFAGCCLFDFIDME